MNDVAEMVCAHLEGILAWDTSRQNCGFPEAIDELFQAPNRKARGYVRLGTIRRAIFMIACKRDSSCVNLYVVA